MMSWKQFNILNPTITYIFSVINKWCCILGVVIISQNESVLLWLRIMKDVNFEILIFYWKWTISFHEPFLVVMQTEIRFHVELWQDSYVLSFPEPLGRFKWILHLASLDARDPWGYKWRTILFSKQFSFFLLMRLYNHVFA